MYERNINMSSLSFSPSSQASQASPGPLKKTQYFLGSNSYNGFYSLYSEFIDAKSGDVLHIIKGGPGCGKSSFMRCIGKSLENRGFSVEYILCSGDPDSLDGIYCPELKVAWADGTAPHVLEPTLPAISEDYINLGAFYKSGELSSLYETALRINTAYKLKYAEAYNLLKAVSFSKKGLYDPLVTDKLKASIKRRTDGIILRELKVRKCKKQGVIRRRFLGAFSCMGSVFLNDTVLALTSRQYLLDNEYGFSNMMLSQIVSACIEYGHDAVVCPSPLDPETIEHVLIPSLDLAFISGTNGVSIPEPYRHIRLDAMADNSAAAAIRPKARDRIKASNSLLRQAAGLLSEAKAIHDELESLYNPHVDFEGVYALAHLTEKGTAHIIPA